MRLSPVSRMSSPRPVTASSAAKRSWASTSSRPTGPPPPGRPDRSASGRAAFAAAFLEATVQRYACRSDRCPVLAPAVAAPGPGLRRPGRDQWRLAKSAGLPVSSRPAACWRELLGRARNGSAQLTVYRPLRVDPKVRSRRNAAPRPRPCSGTAAGPRRRPRSRGPRPGRSIRRSVSPAGSAAAPHRSGSCPRAHSMVVLVSLQVHCWTGDQSLVLPSRSSRHCPVPWLIMW